MAGVTAELLDAARLYNNITWNDADENALLTGILSRGMAYLDKRVGTELDYTAEDIPRGLLLDYSMYAREKALDEFERNYATEINSLRCYYEGVAALKEAEGSEETTA